MVSIVIPTYNGSAYLAEALESAMSQTYQDVEILVCDDNSTDGTLAVAESCRTLDGRIQIRRNRSNLGLVGNWNRSIRLAKGEWIKFLFQDDLLHHRCLETMMSHAGANSFIMCERNFIIEPDVSQLIQDFYENRVTTLETVFNKAAVIHPDALSKAVFKQGLGVNFMGEPSSVLIKKKLFDQYGFFLKELVHICDLEFWTRIGSNKGLFYIPEKLASFRVHNRSASFDNHSLKKFELEYMDELLLTQIYLKNKAYARLREVPKADKLLQEFLKMTLKRTSDYLSSEKNEKYLCLFNRFVRSL